MDEVIQTYPKLQAHQAGRDASRPLQDDTLHAKKWSKAKRIVKRLKHAFWKPNEDVTVSRREQSAPDLGALHCQARPTNSCELRPTCGFGANANTRVEPSPPSGSGPDVFSSSSLLSSRKREDWNDGPAATATGSPMTAHPQASIMASQSSSSLLASGSPSVAGSTNLQELLALAPPTALASDGSARSQPSSPSQGRRSRHSSAQGTALDAGSPSSDVLPPLRTPPRTSSGSSTGRCSSLAAAWDAVRHNRLMVEEARAMLNSPLGRQRSSTADCSTPQQLRSFQSDVMPTVRRSHSLQKSARQRIFPGSGGAAGLAAGHHRRPGSQSVNSVLSTAPAAVLASEPLPAARRRTADSPVGLPPRSRNGSRRATEDCVSTAAELRPPTPVRGILRTADGSGSRSMCRSSSVTFKLDGHVLDALCNAGDDTDVDSDDEFESYLRKATGLPGFRKQDSAHPAAPGPGPTVVWPSSAMPSPLSRLPSAAAAASAFCTQELGLTLPQLPRCASPHAADTGASPSMASSPLSSEHRRAGSPKRAVSPRQRGGERRPSTHGDSQPAAVSDSDWSDIESLAKASSACVVKPMFP